MSSKEEIMDFVDYSSDEEGNYVILVNFFNRIFKENFSVLKYLFQNIQVLPFIKKLEKLEVI